jgi:hypothetical protein
VSPSDELTVGWLRKAATVGLIPLGFEGVGFRV